MKINIQNHIDEINHYCSQIKNQSRYSYPNEIKNKVRQLYKAGYSVLKISTVTPISRATIRIWVKKNKKRKSYFRKVSISHAPSLLLKIVHPSGFFIEIQNEQSLEMILKKIKSI